MLPAKESSALVERAVFGKPELEIALTPSLLSLPPNAIIFTPCPDCPTHYYCPPFLRHQYRLLVCLTRFERRLLVLALRSAAAFVLYTRLNHLPFVTYEPAFQPPLTFLTGMVTYSCNRVPL